jgi:polysaccharide biosynthesis/export protein
MRHIIGCGYTGRCSLAFIVFFLLTAFCFAQQPSTASKPVPQAARAVPPGEATPPAAQQRPPKPPDASIITNPEPTPTQTKGKANTGKRNRPGEISATGVQEKPYEIGPEDILYLNVLHQNDVSGQLNVRPDGYITVRFAGEIKAAGMTTQQLADTITEKLTAYFNHPEVNIQILRINSKKYYVSGEIRKPGAYLLSTPKTVLEAIIEAGGLADFAKKKSIYILRGQQKIPFNFNDVSKGKKLEQNILLENGDVIVVP